MGTIQEIIASLASPDAIFGGLILGGLMWTQPPKWAWRILAIFFFGDCAILSSRWAKVIYDPRGYPAPEDMGILEQADVTRAGIQLAGAILIATLAYLALRARWKGEPKPR